MRIPYQRVMIPSTVKVEDSTTGLWPNLAVLILGRDEVQNRVRERRSRLMRLPCNRRDRDGAQLEVLLAAECLDASASGRMARETSQLSWAEDIAEGLHVCDGEELLAV